MPSVVRLTISTALLGSPPRDGSQQLGHSQGKPHHDQGHQSGDHHLAEVRFLQQGPIVILLLRPASSTGERGAAEPSL